MEKDEKFDKEDSPDWLRTFQTPLKDFKSISSSSPSSSSHDRSLKERSKSRVQDHDLYQIDNLKEEIGSVQSSEKIPKNRVNTVVNLDSDSDQGEGADGFLAEATFNKGANLFRGNKQVSDQAKDVKLQEVEDCKDEGLLKVEGAVLPEEEADEGQERRIKRVVSSLPLVFGDKVHRSKVLLECEGDALDVSGDVGAVGRISLLSTNHDNDFLLDLKGIIYKATIVPSNTFLVVNVGQSEAKVDAIMNDFVQLQPSANIFETETMVEGTLDGFGFDSDDDGDYAPVATGLGNTANLQDEPKDEKKQANQKARSNKSSKGLKGSIKKIGKSKTKKPTGKGGGTRKHVKKASTQKRTGK